jgi:hypothetical protein
LNEDPCPHRSRARGGTLQGASGARNGVLLHLAGANRSTSLTGRRPDTDPPVADG